MWGQYEHIKPSYEATGGAVSGFSLKVECLTVWTPKRHKATYAHMLEA